MKYIVGFLFALVLTSWIDQASAADIVGQCVYPNIEPFKVVVYTDPTSDAVSDQLIHYESYTVGARTYNRIGLWSVPDYRKSDPYANSGLFIGWVERSQFDIQALRNCT